MKTSVIYYTYKINIKTKLLEDYVNFLDSTKKQNEYFKKIISLIVATLCLFLIFVLFKYLNEQQFFSRTNIQN